MTNKMKIKIDNALKNCKFWLFGEIINHIKRELSGLAQEEYKIRQTELKS